VLLRGAGVICLRPVRTLSATPKSIRSPHLGPSLRHLYEQLPLPIFIPKHFCRHLTISGRGRIGLLSSPPCISFDLRHRRAIQRRHSRANLQPSKHEHCRRSFPTRNNEASFYHCSVLGGLEYPWLETAKKTRVRAVHDV
jgi:hypothetical protein